MPDDGSSLLSIARKSMQLLGPARRTRFLLVGILSVLISGLEAVSALLVLVILQLVLEPGSVPEFPLLGDVGRFLPEASYEQLVLGAVAVFATFFVVRGGLFMFQQYALARVAENTGVMLADRLVDGYLSMPYEFHLRRNSSELIRNAYDNVQQVVAGVFTPMVTLMAEISMAVAMLVVLLIASVPATAVAVVAMGFVLALTMRVIQPRLKARGFQRQRAARSALQHLQQGLGGIRDIKILGKEAVFSRDFLAVRREMAEAQYTRTALAMSPRITMETTFLLLILAALAVAVSTDQVTGILSTLGVFAYAGMRLQPSLQKIANAFNNLRFAEAAIEDMAADLDRLDASTSARRRDDRDSARLPFREALELRDVGFRYEGAMHEALRGVHLAIQRGESIGIAGATGGGKTTLLDILCGLLEPTSGEFLVDGEPVRDHLRAWQRGLGVVHQNSFLIDDTLRKNIALGVHDEDINEDLLDRCIRLAQLEEVVAGLPDGVRTMVGERGIRLSGGQRQRITLARALYRQPEVLILDEGTAALDNETERAVIRGIESLTGEMTLIMVAHRLTTLQRCDRIVFLEHGKVSAIGRYQDLVASHAGFRRMDAGMGTGVGL